MSAGILEAPEVLCQHRRPVDLVLVDTSPLVMIEKDRRFGVVVVRTQRIASILVVLLEATLLRLTFTYQGFDLFGVYPPGVLKSTTTAPRSTSANLG